MSYYAYDTQGYVGDVASIGGWEDFAQTVQGRSLVVDQLLEEGYADNVAALTSAVEHLEGLHGSVENTRVNLLSLLRIAQGTFTVSEGYSEQA